MHAYLLCFFIGSLLGLFACEFADRWAMSAFRPTERGQSKRYHSPLPKKIFIFFLCGIGAAWLYWWVVEKLMIYPAYSVESSFCYSEFALFVWCYLVILFTFLLAATLTDFYEMIIPDTITVVGTVLALFIAVLFPFVALPVTKMYWSEGYLMTVSQFAEAMHVWSPNPMGTSSPLAMTLLWWFWCFAMLDRVWYTKLPFRKANAIFWRYLYRSPRTKYIVAAAVILPAVAAILPSAVCRLPYLQSALVGMATGMILIWSVRLVAQRILGVEAMGFGDVTLMGMIGAFLGWQAVLLIFFIAPFFGLIYGIINVLLGRGRAVPYGPFLCLATVFVVVAWSPIWSATAEFFAFGIGTIGLGLFVLLFLFAGLLHVVHKLMSGLRR